MKRSGLSVVILGTLIVAGLMISILGDRVTLEGIAQGNGRVDATQEVTIAVHLDSEETPEGVFAVQTAEFGRNALSATVLDPSGIEIVSAQGIDRDTIESTFDVRETGTYKLVIQSSDSEEAYVAGAIGAMPDAGKKIVISAVSSSCIIAGMVGLIVIGVLGIKNKRKTS